VLKIFDLARTDLDQSQKVSWWSLMRNEQEMLVHNLRNREYVLEI
jgi:hypothetical protein